MSPRRNVADSAKELERLMTAAGEEVTLYLKRKYADDPDRVAGWQRLNEAMRYSLVGSGAASAKRFRPAVALFVADAMDVERTRAMPIAAAVECVHTYSLIHDDLPAMDNDDFRRGVATSHKVFGEGLAILAGDALLTDAFGILAEGYAGEAKLGVQVIGELAAAAGSQGMVGGQAIDLLAQRSGPESAALAKALDAEDLRLMHQLKTGALIRFAAVGVGILAKARDDEFENLSDYASALGLGFQVADDLLDGAQGKIEPSSYVAVLGAERTRELLDDLTDEALSALRRWNRKADPLRWLVEFNLHRGR